MVDFFEGDEGDEKIQERKIEKKNKIRRLYDIINVFKALGLIKKDVTNKIKASFVWKESVEEWKIG